MRRKGVRRMLVAVALAGVMVVGRASPAGAFLSALDPAGWAVVAQMAAIISQAVAIKRQVENVRNQARAEFFGKLAPLTGKLSVVSGWLRNTRSQAGVSIYMPRPSAPLLPTTLPEFNRPMEPCTGGATPADGCMPPIAAVSIPMSTVGSLVQRVRTGMPAGAPGRARIMASARRLRQRGRANVAQARAAAERSENRRAVSRALIEEQMAVVEDWRGCQEAAPGAWNPSGDDRLPCMTNGGRGREDSGPGRGTQGVQSDLVAKLDALERYQDGDVSKVQLDTLQTQMIVMLGRLEASRAEREAMKLEEEQRARAELEAERRRLNALLDRDLQCKASQGPSSYFIQQMPPRIPPVGRCLVVNDVSAAAISAAANSCLIPGRC
jgi:hypothetical protein